MDIAELAKQVKRTPTAAGALINHALERWKTKNQKANAPRGFWDELSDATGIQSEHLKQRVKRAATQEDLERMRSSAPTSSEVAPIEPVVDPAAGEPGTELAADESVEGEYVDDGDGRFVLPATAAEADQLNGELGQLAMAVEWKRAALVYARVYVADSPGRPTEKVNPDLLTPKQYAGLGIHGLRSKTTVRRYWRIWQRAVEEGNAVPVKLGDCVQLPTVGWDEYLWPPEVEQPEESSAITDNHEAFEADERAEEDADTAVGEDRGHVAPPPERTPVPDQRMSAAWKWRLQVAARRVDKAIDLLVAAHEAHPAGSADGDAKTRARLAADIARWVEKLESLDVAVPAKSASVPVAGNG
ncbi:Mycobacterium numidiamassiliense ORFan [Mycobacterium numidiamassiliense]|uniref:Mycobacterium numidiamassiliense ORFan n=1 Tax=Mycobacterium numidiamassiliense TaxID=1841861 RepID=A0A2U3PIK6_9MYCO|nr:hypothetical protein [Mycobacterium numidiamassiliense]SPM43590.1 Mycobacterium numidiamassiliense ORFan [Mycobacterium numidiamassiliense]